MAVTKEKKYFGTDGIRGKVGEGLISADRFLKLCWAIGMALAAKKIFKVVLAKDTRRSCYMLEAAAESGFVAAGLDVYLLGPMSTPGAAYLTRSLKAAGLMITASHNLCEDNGVKLFSPEGTKLSDELEYLIEEYLEQPFTTVESKNLGRAMRINDAQGRYIEFCKNTFPSHLSLKGLKIVVDCANGAAYNIAPNVFRELGAEVIAIGVSPDGLNINYQCGATAPQGLAEKVKEHKADLGVALDGDGDRIIMVDHTGTIVDGDEILFIIARWYLHNKKEIGGIAGTMMSNLGLELACAKLEVPFCRTKVGDRYVLEAMQQRNWMLGGESSGHILCLDAHSTGDGIIAALRVLAAMVTFGETLFEQRQHMQKHPQVLINVPLHGPLDLSTPEIKFAVAAAERELKKDGRVLLRTSGTESLVRVMVEGKDAVLVKRLARELANTVESLTQCIGETHGPQIFSRR
jgi:phosphoglucosamine mutase